MVSPVEVENGGFGYGKRRRHQTGLYGFAQKPRNQTIPYTSSKYAITKDIFTLCVLLQGWQNNVLFTHYEPGFPAPYFAESDCAQKPAHSAPGKIHSAWEFLNFGVNLELNVVNGMAGSSMPVYGHRLMSFAAWSTRRAMPRTETTKTGLSSMSQEICSLL